MRRTTRCIGGALCAGLALPFPAPAEAEPDELAPAAPAVGEAFPSLSFESVEGGHVDVGSLRGRVVLVDFWATWCGPCRVEIPKLVDIFDRYHPKGLDVVGVSLDTDGEALRRYVKTAGMRWPQYFDGRGWENRISRQFGVRGIPATFLIDREGILRFRDLRGEALEWAVDALCRDQDGASAAADTLDRVFPLLNRIESLERRVGELETAVEGLLEGKASAKPFHEKIRGVSWDGEEVLLAYGGERGIRAETLGALEHYLDGLAFHPDGRIAYSYGRGTSPEMAMSFWEKDGVDPPVVKIQYAQDRGDGQRESEEKGFFWFFGGPLAFDPAGVCYFSLGSCSPNGLYAVESADPVSIRKLYDVGSTRDLQIPLFDRGHLYSTSHNGIFRYPLDPGSGEPDEKPWFRVIGDRLLLGHSLILSPTRVAVFALVHKGRDAGEDQYDSVMLYFDREAKKFWQLTGDAFGPMAISWDGSRTIYYSTDQRALCEFLIPSE